MTSIHSQLKSGTESLHEAAEDLLQGGDVLRSRAGYAEFLRLQLSFVHAWESTAARWLPQPYRARWSQQQRGSALQRDLEFLEAKEPPARRAPSWAEGAAHAWGVAYVLEGSALGGRVLARRIQASLDLGECGLSFLNGTGTGSDVGVRWSGFLRDLEEGTQSMSGGAVLDGARAGFEFVLEGLPEVVAMHRRDFGQTAGG